VENWSDYARIVGAPPQQISHTITSNEPAVMWIMASSFSGEMLKFFLKVIFNPDCG
jgi:hypothetical protein